MSCIQLWVPLHERREENRRRQDPPITQEVFSYTPAHCSSFCFLGAQSWVEKWVEEIWRGKWKIPSAIIRSNDPASPLVLAGLIAALIADHCRRFALKYSLVKHAGHYAIKFT